MARGRRQRWYGAKPVRFNPPALLWTEAGWQVGVLVTEAEIMEPWGCPWWDLC